jgi:hypothetical protein
VLPTPNLWDGNLGKVEFIDSHEPQT